MKRVKIIGFCAIALMLLLFASNYYRSWKLSRVYEVVLQVKGTYWERVIYLEEYKTLTEEKWADSVPDGAKKIASHIVPAGTNVFLYEETYTEIEKYKVYNNSPVYRRGYSSSPEIREREVTKHRNVFGPLAKDREMVTYEIKHWLEADKSKAFILNSDSLKIPTWPDAIVDNMTTRAGRKTEFYLIKFATTEGEPKTYSVSFGFDDWQKYQVGQKFTSKFRGSYGEPYEFTLVNNY